MGGVRRGVAALAVMLVVACGGEPGQEPDSSPSPTPTPSPPPPPPDLMLSFDDGFLDAAANSGTQEVTLNAASAAGGSIEQASGPDGSPALRFPPYREPDPPLAVLTVLPTKDDFLSPGLSDFEIGVDFSVDEQSEGGTDNGNNLVQRGLFSNAAQYKLQLDDGVVSCRVQGSRGEAVVGMADPVSPDTWYRARCARRGDTVTLRVGELDPSGAVQDEDEAETVAPTGEVTFAAGSPLSVGAKVLPTGEVVPTSPDQFNGALDNVLYTRF